MLVYADTGLLRSIQCYYIAGVYLFMQLVFLRIVLPAVCGDIL